jgi:hypothetical protein
MKPLTAANGRRTDPLTPRQEAAALALAAGATVGEAARRGNCGGRTIRTWQAGQPAFNRRVQELRAEMTARALGRLVEGMAGAAEALRKLLTAKSETVRLGAARAIIEMGSRLRETVELEDRLATLEQRQAGRRGA